MNWATRVNTVGAFAAGLSALALAASCSSEDPPNAANTAGNATVGNATTGSGPVTGVGGAMGSSSSGSPTTTGSTGTAAAVSGATDGSTTAGVTGTGGAATTGVASTGAQATMTSTGSVSTSGGGTGGGDDWWFSGPRTPPPLGTWPPPSIKLTEVSQATQPTAIAAPRADNSRLYFTEKWGVIRLIKDGTLLPEPALDIRDEVLEGGPTGDRVEAPQQGKRGLVGLAFDPNYEQNGRIFVMYTADQGEKGMYGTAQNPYDDGDMTIAEYRRSASDPDKFDPASAKIIVTFDKGDCNQCSQHNGGSLEIDVDGFLWASTGDPPPYNNPGSQDPMNLNGKLLRFDISGDTVVGAGNYPGGDPMVSSIGIRNAYKFSFDRYTGDAFVADVGENDWEELTIERYGDRNKDHGWPKVEATHFMEAQSCGEANCVEPVFEYKHGGPEGTPGADTCIIGGYVYRGAAIPALQGTYIYGDFGSGRIRALQVVDGVKQNGTGVQDGLHNFSNLPNVFMGCFGEDAAGELYICDYEGGRILRIDAE